MNLREAKILQGGVESVCQMQSRSASVVKELERKTIILSKINHLISPIKPNKSLNFLTNFISAETEAVLFTTAIFFKYAPIICIYSITIFQVRSTVKRPPKETVRTVLSVNTISKVLNISMKTSQGPNT